MIDFTFLLVLILVLVAFQQGMLWIGIGLLALLLFTAKSKILLFAAVIGIALAVLLYAGGEAYSWLVVAGLFIVLLLLVKNEPKGSPEFYPQPGY
jgi:hypothetical protein